MARVKITEAAFGRQSSGVAVLLDGASVLVNDSTGSPATVYEDAVSGSTLPNPVTSENGRIPGWLDEGYYELVVTYDGDTADAVPFEARAAYPSGGSTGEVLAVASGGGVEWKDPNDLLGAAPWRIDISPLTPPATQTNFSTLNTNASQLGNGYKASTGAQNAEIGWDVLLAAGEWRVDVLGISGNDRGIITATLDGVTVGTMDYYSSVGTFNVLKNISGITVDSTGKKRLLFKMATKHASSSSYHCNLTHVSLTRTA